MILYHGSNVKVTSIDLEKSNNYKDFGKGFYLSDTIEQAKEMAQYKALQLGGVPIVSLFEFDIEGIKNLNTKHFYSYSEAWVDFIIANRSGKAVEHYDYVYGPIANDKVGRQLRFFKDQEINKQELIERLKYFKGITFQYYFGSKEAISLLKDIQ